MNRARLEQAETHLRRAELGACCTAAIATVLHALAEHRTTITTGGPAVDVDHNWAPGTLPPPPSASDPAAPALVRGPNRTAPR